VDSRWGPIYGDAVSTPSDPQRGGPKPDSTPDTGQPERGAGEQPAGEPAPYQPPGQYGGQYGAQPGQYGNPQGQYPPHQYGGQYGSGQPYGQPPQYGGQGQYGQNPQYGQQPAYGPPGGYNNPPYSPYGNQPYGSAEGQGGYAYSPYGTPAPYPAGLEDGGSADNPRPGVMVGALILLILSALPFLIVGALMAFAIGTNVLPPEILNDPRFAEAGLTPDLVVSAVRLGGGVMTVVALLYLLFAVLAFRGRNWARVMVTVMTIGFALLLLSGLVTGASGDAGSLGFLLAVVALCVGGTVLMYLPASTRFFANQKG
jgi:hypothetical protein